MTAICRLNVDDILSEWTNERAYFSRSLLSNLVPAPEKNTPPSPRLSCFLTNWCDPRVTRHIRRHFSRTPGSGGEKLEHTWKYLNKV